MVNTGINSWPGLTVPTVCFCAATLLPAVNHPVGKICRQNLKRNITSGDISGSALYLLSDLSSGVTGEIHHVDSGYNIIGMKDLDSPDIFEEK